MQTVNERLAALPELLGYDSPAALAKASGLDPNTLRKAMQGPSKPGYEMLAGILSRHKRLSADWLLLGTGQPLADTPAPGATPTEPTEPGPAGEARMPATVQRRTLTPTMRASRALDDMSDAQRADYWRTRHDEVARELADLREANSHADAVRLVHQVGGASFTKASADAADSYPEPTMVATRNHDYQRFEKPARKSGQTYERQEVYGLWRA